MSTVGQIAVVSNFHDALPYVDPPMSSYEDKQTEIQQLLKEEIENSKNSKKLVDYKADVEKKAPQFTFASTVLFSKELKELEANNGQLPPRENFLEKYNIPIPTQMPSGAEEADTKSLETSLDNLRRSVALHQNHVIDLELLTKYNTPIWDISFQRTDIVKKYLEAEIESVKNTTDIVNRKRKQEQVTAQATINKLSEQYSKQVSEQYTIGSQKNKLEDAIEKRRKVFQNISTN